jgi:thiol-disulfide isomerase/thioredoxin
VAKPIVDGIEKDLKGKAEVVRLNLLSKVGREAASRYGIRGVPTILILDPDGEVIYRHTGRPNRHEVVAQIAAP